CVGNLAILHRLRGDVTTARALNEKARAGLIAKVSRDHHYSLSCAVSLQSDLAALGESDEASRLGEDTLGRLRSLLGENHFLSLACAGNLALDLRAAGAEKEAEILYADTMRRYERPLEIGHPDARDASEGRRIDCDFDPPPI
ncbi:tetratricopeptide repeat protein, partial [Streptosporangium vulgare]